MFKKAAFVFVFIFVVSCQDLHRPEKPKNLLSPTEMENILTDMVLLDAMISVNNFRIDNHEIDVPNFIYEKYEIDSITLSKNIEYYNEDYQANTEIYKNVKINVENLKQNLEYNKELQDSIQQVKIDEKRVQDSLLQRQR